MFEIHYKVFDKLVIYAYFVTFANIVDIMFSFYGASTQNREQKIITGPLYRCGIL